MITQAEDVTMFDHCSHPPGYKDSQDLSPPPPLTSIPVPARDISMDSSTHSVERSSSCGFPSPSSTRTPEPVVVHDDSATCHFLSLNEDVIEVIFEFLRQEKYRLPLSLTCKYIRQACKPHFFRNTRIYTDHDVMSGRIFQMSSDIWLYVSHLTFSGTWVDRKDEQRVDLGELQRPLSDLLSSMPFLHTISLINGWNGMPWDALKTILSVAQLRHLEMCMSPERRRPYPVDTDPFSVVPLETFEVKFDDMRFNTVPYIGEQSLFAFVIPQLSDSLESLRLPLDSAPLGKLASTYWPRLQRLHLSGDRRLGQDKDIPIIAVLSVMPNLRSFTFLSAQKENTRRDLIWPDGTSWSFSCPLLEHLQISYPDPQDRFFSNLPRSLRKLSLRCWPRHYLHRYEHERQVMDENGWRSPIPTSSEMLTVLENLPSEYMTELEIEYIEDDGDEKLLQSLSRLFPALTALTLLRYRRQGDIHVPVDRIAQDLSTLAQLRILRVHLDFAGDPHPYAALERTTHDHEIEACAHLRHNAAQVLADRLSASFRCVCVLTRLHCLNMWPPFLVVRDSSGIAHIENDPSLHSFDGLPMDDDDGPSTIYDCW
ncbi:hypothetical protein PYCCODRAFT_1459202 [Trametes coccinea BRFM310]|uniref:F-box domain-containing protein n=1 Tax=Trametes coccinea (strain BRFM310) TaxID=1353009 RepID=A0A1Y2IME6_TRAC3|nr:hypothetical protein PYCCODRAFT_1459202 [Trametes coccinea BRFM310]